MDEELKKPIPGQANQASDSEEVTPEEEAQISKALEVALTVIHGEGKTGDEIARLVLETENVADGIGGAIATVLLIVSKKLQFSDDIKLIVAQEIFMELTSLAVDAGALSEDEINDEFVDRAVSKAYTNYLTAKESMGELDPNELKMSVEQATAEGRELGIIKDQPSQAQDKPMNQAQGLLARVSGGA